MIWIIILLLVLTALCYFLLAPFFLELDSRRSLCRFRFHRLASARLYISEDTLMLDLKITWWVKTIDLFAPRKKPKKKVTEKKKKKERKMMPLKKIMAVIRSFRVNKCIVNMDTGNIPLNGILYPAFLWLGHKTGKEITINFRDKNEIIFETENNIARMLWAYIHN